jgi:hypothetical protein
VKISVLPNPGLFWILLSEVQAGSVTALCSVGLERNLPQSGRGTSNPGAVCHTGKPAMPGPGPSA